MRDVPVCSGKRYNNKSFQYYTHAHNITKRSRIRIGVEEGREVAAPGGSVEVAAEQSGQVVGAVQRRPSAERSERRVGRVRGVRGVRVQHRAAHVGRGGAGRGQRYLARELRREGGQPGRRQLAERRVRVLHQRLVRVRLPRAAAAAAATCTHTHTHNTPRIELHFLYASLPGECTLSVAIIIKGY